ncbi:MAG: GNAT family N-acetyltransferase [Candidatus Lokiarchaeota archaeon]|nr:GNAT family N-acetyltransferase [Candidatus Lokiarchaeota archaeon]
MVEKEEKEVPVFIEGKEICFAVQDSDNINLYAKWMNNPKVRVFARWETPIRVEDMKKWFEPQEGRVPNFVVFEIWHKKDKKPIGQCGLGWINWVSGWANAFLYIGEPEYWGKNIATEATEMLIEYAFNELNLNKLHGGAAVENIGSWSVAEKVGFKFEGIQKNDMYVNGKYHDGKTYRILKEDWMNKKNKKD